MADHSADDEMADMGDREVGADYALSQRETASPRELPIPSDVKNAIRKAEEEIDNAPPPPPQPFRFQFTIRDMLVLTAVVAFVMGVFVSVRRGMPVFGIYSIFFLVVIAAWFGVGLWKAGYWRKSFKEEEKDREQAESRPTAESGSLIGGYSVVDIVLAVAGFGFLMSLATLLPGTDKMANVAGVMGLCTLLGLVWLAIDETRRPALMMIWWVSFAMYLIASLAVALAK
jgi:Ca2+/Na+ antiporter